MQQELEDRLRAGLAPNIELIRAIGRGSHSYVFLGRQAGLKRLVAVKVLRPELNRDAIVRRRFEREAQSAARLDHPNVTPIHGVGQIDDDLPFIVMKYIDGRTLEDALAASGPLPVREAKDVLAGLAAGLAAAHYAGIVHRDVRPGNVFLEKQSGHAVLADFGIAGLLETGGETITRLTDSGIRLGDSRYMSPEQIEGASATERSDIYSFGMLAYETLTGQAPYEAGTVQMMVIAHLKQQPKPLAPLVPGLERPLADLIERCLSKDPNRRPTAADLAARLSGAVPAAVVPPTPTSPVVRFIQELRRRKVVTVTAWYLTASAGAVAGLPELLGALGFESDLAPRVLAVIAAAGLPIVLALSWIYDITSTGISKTAGPDQPGPRRLPAVALGLAILVSAILGVWLFQAL